MRALTHVHLALAVPYIRNIDLNLNPSISCNLKELEEPVQWTLQNTQESMPILIFAYTTTDLC